MASFNQVTLIGNVTRDPVLRQLPNGETMVAEFGFATNRRFRTPGGEEREEVTFVDCSAFGRQAEVIHQYCTKGKPLFLQGRLKYDTWDDKNGGKRSKLSVVVEQFQFIGGRDGAGSWQGAAGEADKRGPREEHEEREQRSQRGPRGQRGEESPGRRVEKFSQADIPF